MSPVLCLVLTIAAMAMGSVVPEIDGCDLKIIEKIKEFRNECGYQPEKVQSGLYRVAQVSEGLYERNNILFGYIFLSEAISSVSLVKSDKVVHNDFIPVPERDEDFLAYQLNDTFYRLYPLLTKCDVMSYYKCAEGCDVTNSPLGATIHRSNCEISKQEVEEALKEAEDIFCRIGIPVEARDTCV